MSKNFLMCIMEALIHNRTDEAIGASKKYFIGKMKQIIEDVETGVPFKVRKDYARAYQRHYNRHMNSKQAEEDAYADVIRHHGKELHDQLKDYHRTNLREQQLISELSKKTLQSYHAKSVDDIDDRAYDLGARSDKSSKSFDRASDKLENRKKHVKKAFDKLTKPPVNEIADKTLGGNIVGTEHTHEVIDGQTGKSVGKYRSMRRARHAADKKDLEYGAIRYHAKPIKKSENGVK